MNESAAAWVEQWPRLRASKPRFRLLGPQERRPYRWAAAPRGEDYFAEACSGALACWLPARASIYRDFLAVQSAVELNFAQAAPLESAVAQEAASWRRLIGKLIQRPLPEERSDS